MDKSGRTQIAAVIPDEYKKAETCTDSQQDELSASQRRAAELRSAQLQDNVRSRSLRAYTAAEMANILAKLPRDVAPCRERNGPRATAARA